MRAWRCGHGWDLPHAEDGTAVIRLSGELDMVSVENVRSVIEGALADQSDRLAFEVARPAV